LSHQQDCLREHEEERKVVNGRCIHCYNSYLREYNRDYSKQRREQCIELLGGKCHDCPIEDRRVLEFDHVPERGLKAFNIAKTTMAWPKILVELDKCDLVCANCHRIREWSRRR